MTSAETWPLSIAEWRRDCDLAGLYGKTCQASCRLEEGRISGASSKPLLTSGMAFAGECLTLKTSESHSGAVACGLSDILETGDLPQRFFLSQKACAGILRMAEKRGKKLPEQLERALVEVLARKTPLADTCELASA